MSLTSQSSIEQKRPSKLWWLFAMLILLGCILAQLPVSWIVQKYAPNTPYVQWVSGSLFQGSARWQLPNPTSSSVNNFSTNNDSVNSASLNSASVNNTSLSSVSSNDTTIAGSLNWQLKPLKLLIGKVSADVDISSGQSRLNGEMNTGIIGLFAGMSGWQLQGMSGRIHHSTLAEVVDWQLPDAPIQVNNLSMAYDKEAGFSDTDGQLTWVGGQLGYPNAGRVLQINLPAMIANINSDNNVLIMNLVNQQDKSLGNFKVNKDGMLDVNLTQRLLENMPSYNGSAPQDTAVVSIRQPLSSLGK